MYVYATANNNWAILFVKYLMYGTCTYMNKSFKIKQIKVLDFVNSVLSF